LLCLKIISNSIQKFDPKQELHYYQHRRPGCWYCRCIMIFIIIRFQTSFDNFHSKKDRIYRVLTEYHHADAANTGKDVPFYAEGLKTTFAQIEQVAPVWASHNDKLLIQL